MTRPVRRVAVVTGQVLRADGGLVMR